MLSIFVAFGCVYKVSFKYKKAEDRN